MCVVIALASAASVCASGQTTMTLKECMAYAISNSTKIRIQEAAIGDAQIDRRDAALALFTPQINAQTVAYYNFGRNIDPETNLYIQTTSFHNSYGVSAGYDLFDGFKAVNNYKISKTGLLIAQSQEKQVEADICLAVMEAYYNVVYYKRLTDVYEEQVATAESALKKAKRQEELGQKGHADVIQMEADLADRQYDLTNTFNKYQSEKMKLADLMFWPVDEELVIDTSMPEWEVEPVSTSAVVNFALDHNPGVNMASWKELNAKRELSTAKWQLMPSIGLYGGWNTNYFTYPNQPTAPFGTQFRNNMGEYVQLTLSIPIWDRLAKASRISKKRHALDKATAELDQKRRDVESEVRRAVQDRDGAATAYQQALHKADVQNEAYTLNLKKLEQGLISPLEFQTASNNFLKAQADEMNSLFKYLIKQAVVKYYSGVEYVNQ
ncbi:MAG: TolC family protein [Candidatus Cryptobacteroides sp.]|nr:TolC family protein [Candidatus Cryptobacteroides sp.]